MKQNITECSSDDLSAIVDFAFQRNSIKELRCRPFLLNESRQNIEKFYQKYIVDNNSSIVAQYDKNTLIGVMPFYWIEEDKYISIKGGIFATEDSSNNYSSVTSNFIQYLATKFNDYTLYLNLAKEHKKAIAFCENNKFTKLESAELYSLKEFSNCTLDENIQELNKTNKDNIFNYINQIIDENTYWNIERLKNNLDKFIVLAYFDKNIKGAVYAQIYKNHSVEIFGLTAESIKIKEILVNALACKCKELKAKNLILYSDNEDELNMVKEMTFEYLDSDICYMLKIENWTVV